MQPNNKRLNQLVSITPDEYNLLLHISQLHKDGKRVTIELINNTDDTVETIGFASHLGDKIVGSFYSETRSD